MDNNELRAALEAILFVSNEPVKVEVSVVAGSDRNIKITRPTDMELARLFHSLEIAERKAS